MIPHAHEGEAAIFFSAKVTKVKSSGSTVYRIYRIQVFFLLEGKESVYSFGSTVYRFHSIQVYFFAKSCCIITITVIIIQLMLASWCVVG